MHSLLDILMRRQVRRQHLRKSLLHNYKETVMFKGNELNLQGNTDKIRGVSLTIGNENLRSVSSVKAVFAFDCCFWISADMKDFFYKRRL